MSNIGPTTAREMNKDFQRRIGRLERTLGSLAAPRAGVAANRPDATTLRAGTPYFITDSNPPRTTFASSRGWVETPVFVGPDDPSVGLPDGTEYVWFRTDGAGNLQDTIVGMV